MASDKTSSGSREAPPPEQQDQSIKARKSSLFEGPDSAVDTTRPFAEYVKQVPAMPMSLGMKALLCVVATVVVLLLLAALFTGHGARRHRVRRAEATAAPIIPGVNAWARERDWGLTNRTITHGRTSRERRDQIGDMVRAAPFRGLVFSLQANRPRAFPSFRANPIIVPPHGAAPGCRCNARPSRPRPYEPTKRHSPPASAI